MKKGFTLIELLVVIAIIGLLSSIVMVSVQSARQRAEYSSFSQELIQIRNALQAYAADHGDFVLTSTLQSVSGGDDPNDTLENVISALVDGGYLSTEIEVPDYVDWAIIVVMGLPTEPDYYELYSCGDVSTGWYIQVRSEAISDGDIDALKAGTAEDFYCLIQE